MKQSIILLLLIGGLIVSCTDRETTVEDSRSIRFQSSVIPETKGDLITGSQFPVGASMGVLAYPLAGTTWLNDELPTIMYNSKLTKLDVGSYMYDPLRNWPDAGKVKFFAYYPHTSIAEPGAITVSSSIKSGYPDITVVLGINKRAVDFLTAESEPLSRELQAGESISREPGYVNFRLYHRLSKIIFKAKAIGLNASEQKLYIKSLRVKNIYNKATYTFNGASGSWSGHASQGIDGVSGATLNLASALSEVSQNGFEDLVDPYGEGSYILMLPQVYDHTELEFDYILTSIREDGFEDVVRGVKRIPITVDWQMGNIYTYNIEFAFSEVNTVQITYDFTVAPWTPKAPVITEIN